VHSNGLELDGVWVVSSDAGLIRILRGMGSKVTRSRLGVSRLGTLLGAQKAQIAGYALGGA